MNVVRITDEEDLPALVRKLLPGRVSAAVTERFVESIKEANQGVSTDSLTPGMLIFVPEFERAEPATADVLSGTLDSLQAAFSGALAELRQLAEQQQGATAEEYRRVAEAVADSAVREAAGSIPAIAEAVSAAEEEAKAAVVESRELPQVVDELAKGWLVQFEYLGRS